MRDSPLISVLIPTYKRPHLVLRAIDSVLVQSVNVKIIISDNSDNNDTLELIAKKYKSDERIIYIKQPQNLGLIGNFRFLLEAFDTKYFAFLTDDDYQNYDFLDTGLNALNIHKECKFSVQRVPAVTESGTYICDQLDRWSRFGVYEPGEGNKYVANGGHHILTGCIFQDTLRNEFLCLDALGASADMYWLAKLCSKYHFALIDHIGAYFVNYSGSISTHPSGYSYPALSMIHSLIGNDKFIDKTIKDEFSMYYIKYIEKMYIRTIIRAIMRNDWAVAKMVSGTIKQLGALAEITWLFYQIIEMVPCSGGIVSIALNKIQSIRFQYRRNERA